MTNVSIRGLSKRFGGKSPTVAIDNLDLEVGQGEFVVLLGPSGCGKTTTLRCIAGLESPESGRVCFGERPVYDAAAGINVGAHKRNIGMVFQSYALWPHMTVRKNIGYPLRTRRIKRAIASEWIEEVARLVDCGPLLDRYPTQLSGGQQQRVALSRGLVARPDLVLFDEPLSNLDARLRDQVRTEIHELHQRLKFTAVYVTHDQSEALALGDRLAIMRDGRIDQLATPEEVFENPATEYVAEFIGMANRLQLDRRDGHWVYGGHAVHGCPTVASDEMAARARPEDLHLAPASENAPEDAVWFPATVVASEFGGRYIDVVISIGDERLHSRLPAGERGNWARSLLPGDPLLGFFPAGTLTFFDNTATRIPTRGSSTAARMAIGA
ncbi:MAG: iron(III) transport system ATP-binding protein [Gaiellaceae bacterium]|nr:iron(III) transport system ATP-binding protein [Gaiellaceae bacterium]